MKEAAAVVNKFRQKTFKLCHGLQEKYDDTPELSPEGTEEAESRQARKDARNARNAAKNKDGAAGDTSGSSSSSKGGKALSEWDLAELQREIERRTAAAPPADGEEEPEYWLTMDQAAALQASMEPESLVIIGGGPAGLSAAIYAARAGLKPLIVAPAFGGQLLGKGVDVENYPGVMGAEATGRGVVQLMRAQAAGFDTRMVDDAVLAVEAPAPGQPLFSVTINGSRTDGADVPAVPYTVRARAVVVATGADSRWLGAPGEHDYRGKGVSSCATCDGFLYRDQTVVVIGGGDTAMEDALVLARTSSVVKLIHRRDSFRASKVLADRVLNNPKIEVVWNSVVERFVGSEEAGLTAVAIKNVASGEQSSVAAQAAFVAIGHIPNTQFVEGVLPRDDQGYIVRSGGEGEHSTRTKVEGIFVCGDAADKVYRQAVTSAGSGAMAALDAERWLSEQH